MEDTMAVLEQLIDQVLDEKYRIDSQLGQGGMGAVFLATHLGTGRPVAVKIITPQFMDNEEFVARFQREARATGLLRHANVVNVTDFGFTEVTAAHHQGIIHRDLKPDNIWLEPNGRGGYNVKVLDFGLAKLHNPAPVSVKRELSSSAVSTLPYQADNPANSVITQIQLTGTELA